MTNEEARQLPLGSYVVHRGRRCQVMLKHVRADAHGALQVRFTLISPRGYFLREVSPEEIALPPEVHNEP